MNRYRSIHQQKAQMFKVYNSYAYIDFHSAQKKKVKIMNQIQALEK